MNLLRQKDEYAGIERKHRRDDATFKTEMLRHKLSDSDFKVSESKVFFYQKHIVVVPPPPVQEGTAPQHSALIQLRLAVCKTHFTIR